MRNTPTRLPGTPLAPATVALRRRSRSATFRPVDDRNGDGENGAVVVAAVRCSASGSLRWSSSRSAPPSIPPSIPSSIPPYSHRRTPRPPSPAARTTAGSRGGSGRSRAAGPADGERHLTQPPPGSRLPAARSVDQQQGQTRFGIEMWGDLVRPSIEKAGSYLGPPLGEQIEHLADRGGQKVEANVAVAVHERVA